jgi:hypothetical protein
MKATNCNHNKKAGIKSPARAWKPVQAGRWPHSVGPSGRAIGPSQRPLPDNTQHSQETDIHVPGGIRTLNPSKRAAADPHLRQRGHWDRPFWHMIDSKYSSGLSFAAPLWYSWKCLLVTRCTKDEDHLCFVTSDTDGSTSNKEVICRF